MYNIRLLLFLSPFLLLGLLQSCTTKPAETTLTIAAAANTQFAMEELILAFKQQRKGKIDLIVSSSGKLTAQIEKGAPYDLFVSADLEYPTRLYESGLATSTPKIYAHGALVLWSIHQKIPAIKYLTSEDIEVIAIANPDLAPYGVAARETLESYDLWQELAPKIVYGESISQTNQFILTGNAQLGFTAKSVVVAPKMEEKGYWIEIEKERYNPIKQSAVVIQRKNRQAQSAKAQEFLDFMLSEAGQDIFLSFGYLEANE